MTSYYGKLDVLFDGEKLIISNGPLFPDVEIQLTTNQAQKISTFFEPEFVDKYPV